MRLYYCTCSQSSLCYNCAGRKALSRRRCEGAVEVLFRRLLAANLRLGLGSVEALFTLLLQLTLIYVTNAPAANLICCGTCACPWVSSVVAVASESSSVTSTTHSNACPLPAALLPSPPLAGCCLMPTRQGGGVSLAVCLCEDTHILQEEKNGIW